MVKKTKTYDIDGTNIVELLSLKFKEKNYKIKKITETGIILDTPSSVWSWGEEICILIDNKNQGCDITVTSDAKFQFTDWGKSDKNIDKVFVMIDSVIGE